MTTPTIRRTPRKRRRDRTLLAWFLLALAVVFFAGIMLSPAH